MSRAGFYLEHKFFYNIFVGFLFYYIILQASRRLHNRMLHKVTYCHMYFFDTNPSGRVLNRFSTDLIFLDDVLSELFTTISGYI